MNDCYLSLLLNFRALLSIDSGANLVNSKQAIGVILPDLSLLGYAVPVERTIKSEQIYSLFFKSDSHHPILAICAI